MSTSEAWLNHIMVYADEQIKLAIGGCFQECKRVFDEVHGLSRLGNDFYGTSAIPSPFPPPFVDRTRCNVS